MNSSVRVLIGPCVELMNAAVLAIETAMLRSATEAVGCRVHTDSGRPKRSVTATIKRVASIEAAARWVIAVTSAVANGLTGANEIEVAGRTAPAASRSLPLQPSVTNAIASPNNLPN